MADIQIIVEPVACPIDWSNADRTARAHACSHCACQVIDLQNTSPEDLQRMASTNTKPPCVLLPVIAKTLLPLNYAPSNRRFRWKTFAVAASVLAAGAAWANRYFFHPTPAPIKCMSPLRPASLAGMKPSVAYLTVRGRTLTTLPTTPATKN